MSTLAKLIVSIGANTAEFETNLKKVQSQLKAFQKSTKDLDAVMNPIGTALKAVGVAAVAAFSAGGAAALASGQIIEKYRMSLTTLMGSSQAAGQAVASALNLAAKTPFSDDQLLAATVALTKFGQNAKTVLPQVADMAAATNGDVEAAAAAFGGFLQGRVKALASYGITKAAVLAEGAKTEQGIEIANEKGTIVNQEAFSKALLSLMDKRFKAGAELQANSLGGLIKGMKDTGEDILRTIAGFSDDGTVRAGSMFDFFKQGITAVLAKVEEWKANGSLQKWADDVGKAITVFFNGAKIVFNWLVNIGTWVAKNWDLIRPVLAGVLGAFLAFKVVTGVVDGIAIAVAALKTVLIVTNGVLALTPIGAIMLAVAALSVVVVLATQHWNAFRIALGMTTKEASATNIQIAKNALDAYDQITKANRKTMEGDPIQAQALAAYDKQRAQDRIALEKNVQNEIDGVRGAAMDKQGAGQIKAQTDAAAAAKAAAAQVAFYEQQARDAKTAEEKAAADTALKAAQAHAKEVAKVNTDLNDKIYKLSHTTVEGQIYDLARERDAAIADGGSKLKADQAYTLAAKKVYDDARKEKAAADKDAADKTLQAQKVAQDKYLASVVDYVNKQKDVLSTLTSIIIDNYSEEQRNAVNSFNTQRDTAVNALNDAITARQDYLTSTLDTIGKERDATIKALNDMIDKRQSELDATLNALDNEKTAVVNAVEKERDATLNALDDMITKRQDELSSTLDAISEEKAAVLGQYDDQIQALQDSHTAAQDAVTVDQLRTNVIYATTASERTQARAALDKELADESYNTQLSSLQKQKQAASNTYDAETKAAQTKGDAEIQTLRDTVTAAKTSYADQLTSANAYYAAEKTLAQTAGNLQLQQLRDLVTSTQTSYAAMTTAAQTAGNIEIQQLKDAVIAEQKSADARLVFINTFYDQKLATANINADAEKLLATLTSDQIFAMLEAKLPGYAALGAQYGNALYSNVLAAQGAYAALQQTAVQVQPNGKAPAGLSVGATVATAGGNYTITAVKPDGSYTSVPTTTVAPTLNLGGASGGRALMAHALGGYFTTPHIGLIAEKGPEYVVPQSQAAEFASKMGGSDVAAGLRQLGLKMDTLIFATRQVAPGVGSVINGLGRA